MTRSKKATCSNSEARTRLDHAVLYLEVAELVLSDESGSEATVATGNAVLAGIAAADALCCALVGTRYRGADHRGASGFLEEVTGDKELGKALRDLADFKDQAHYGIANVKAQRARSAVRRARRLIEAAEREVPHGS